MADNSEDSFIAPSSPPWYKKIPMPIWVALIGALATIFAAGIQSGWFASEDQPPAAEPTEIVQAETATPPPKECGLSPIYAEFRPYYEKYKGDLGCERGQWNQPEQMAEQLFEGGHIFWMIVEGDWTFVVFDQSKERPSYEDLPTGKWISATGTRNSPKGWHSNGTTGAEGLVPPSSDLQEPIENGWLWRTHLGGQDGDLGWARDTTKGYTRDDDVGYYQQFERGFMFRASDPKIYILLDTGTFYAEQPPK